MLVGHKELLLYNKLKDTIWHNMVGKKKKIYFIINPKSGTSSKDDLPEKINRILNPDVLDISIFFTKYAGHGAEIAQQAAKNEVNYVIAVGGDGTVNEVGRSLVGSKTALGIIPMGSGNGLGRDLQISTNPEKALAIIAEENVIDIDYGIVNGQIFLCTCGVGFDANVAAQAAGEKHRGRLMYIKNMLVTFFQQTPKTYEISFPGGSIKDKAFVITCANASQYGYDAHIAPHADIQDGKMNVIILAPLSILEVPQTSIRLFTQRIDANKNITEIITNKVTIKCEDDAIMHIDGDPIQTGKEINVEIVNKGLKVLVPNDPPKRHPLDPQEILIKMLSLI